TTAKFRTLWLSGNPLVVVHVDTRLQGDWSPAYFVEKYGTHHVTLVDCESERRQASTVADFFASFGDTAARIDGDPVLKLKDWPPEKDFHAVFPELFAAFIDGVPFPDYTRPDGIFNLASHFAVNAVAPDLGPKMYIAHGTSQSDSHHGSTRLHKDITDAVNLLVFAANFTDGRPGYALWHIFPRQATAALCKFLINEGHFRDTGDPIHSQSVYLTPSMLSDLAAKYGVQPYTIVQRVGDAVFIPAGCPHQVSNATDAIKIACDFVSIKNLAASEHLVNELRSQRLCQDWVGDDVLQYYTTLWYAW
ncbi:hypothetical protein BV22DRAFT_988083, partial [Leucogyrophana mollusca]